VMGIVVLQPHVLLSAAVLPDDAVVPLVDVMGHLLLPLFPAMVLVGCGGRSSCFVSIGGAYFGK
jgi:galactitol-specific phosphotransferase system IIC component